ncbi:hypothetical protein LAWI1_G005159 [Lachnellula willkommii]|uniref:N-acetyltransferase domain-containing protein n=1 Tax=Lachnellula willkommii TaxID=215461 RepID=A0A559MCW2_9HELO|nr:hypothetical protein LAWI1_G005159 [Lachnellula willkommii]
MTQIVKEVTSEAEFSAVIDCLWDSYYNPYTPFMNILFPVFSATEEGYAAAVSDSKARLWSYHKGDPTSHWIYVTDTSGKVFSGAHWNFHEVSPYVNSVPKLKATWHPEGQGQGFATHILNQVYGFRGKRMWRPHAQLDMMFTYPAQRRKGYGSLLMEWGMDIAERMGVEVLVEASDQGIHLYKKFGIRTIDKIAVDSLIDNPSNTWRRYESDLKDLMFWWMWKPHGGIYEEGKTDLPWVAKVHE